MRLIAVIIIACTSLLGLSGCDSEKPRTMQWYIDNPDEIKRVKDKCRKENDKGYKTEGVLKENCASANKATARLIRDNLG